MCCFWVSCTVTMWSAQDDMWKHHELFFFFVVVTKWPQSHRHATVPNYAVKIIHLVKRLSMEDSVTHFFPCVVCMCVCVCVCVCVCACIPLWMPTVGSVFPLRQRPIWLSCDICCSHLIDPHRDSVYMYLHRHQQLMALSVALMRNHVQSVAECCVDVFTTADSISVSAVQPHTQRVLKMIPSFNHGTQFVLLLRFEIESVSF